MKRWGLAAAAATLLLGSTAGCSSVSQTDDSVSRYEQTWRMSRVPWNFGSGPMILGDVHEFILHDGSDSFGDLAFEGVA